MLQGMANFLLDRGHITGQFATFTFIVFELDERYDVRRVLARARSWH
jgi:hypothetical protein